MGLHAALISPMKLQSDRLEAQPVEPGSKVNPRNSGFKQECDIFKQVRIVDTKSSIVFVNPMLYICTSVFIHESAKEIS